jgi:hypothetical protein
VVFLSLSHRCLTTLVKTEDNLSSACLDLIRHAIFTTTTITTNTTTTTTSSKKETA